MNSRQSVVSAVTRWWERSDSIASHHSSSFVRIRTYLKLARCLSYFSKTVKQTQKGVSFCQLGQRYTSPNLSKTVQSATLLSTNSKSSEQGYSQFVVKKAVSKFLTRLANHGIFKKQVQPIDIDDSESALKARYVYLTTCTNMWEDVPVGVKFDVSYVDSHPEAPYNIKTPVVVGLHGTPGSHQDLLPILEPMVAQGCRVVIPNFPGYGYTRGIGPGHDDCFTHSPEEKTQFLVDFLTVIGIPRVDLLVGHSAGCYPLTHMCADRSGIQSAMLICPAIHTSYRGIRPHKVLKLISDWWEVPMCRPALNAAVYLASSGGEYKGIPVSHIMTAIRTTLNVNFENVIHNAMAMDQKKFPACVMFSDNDKKIQLHLMKEYIELLGITDEETETYTSDAPDTSRGVLGYPKAVMLEGGGHYPLKKYRNIILSEQLKLLHAISKGR
ncbi:uncharacterized protein LOC135468359 isoform X2 [Liolophura sinensis]